MSAKADALRFPGTPTGRSPGHVVLLGLVLAAAVVATLAVVSSIDGTTTAPVPPNSVSHTNEVVAPASAVVQVGGTSVYRFHPLPGVNTVFELVRPASAGAAKAGGANAKTDTPTVGGSGAYQYHLLP